MYYVYTYYDAITNGNVKERLSFDAWGNRRNPNNWAQAEATGTSHIFSRGFTGHEHLDNFGIINMNGRLYDPIIARFFSPDPFVVDPLNTQDFNRYSYARNNPLMYTDPSGNIVLTLLSAIICPPLAPYAAALDAGWMTGAEKALSTPGMTFLDGAWRGALVAVAGTLLAPIGGGGLNLSYNMLMGASSGALTGALNAALWKEDVSDGIKYGALSGMLFSVITSDEFSNFTRGKGFRSNNSVLNSFSTGKYTAEGGIWQQDALDYFGFEGRYKPELTSKRYEASDYWGATNSKTGQISYGNLAFENYATLKGTYIKEFYHSQKILNGIPIERLPIDIQGIGMDTYLEEIYGYVHTFKQQGLFLNHNIPMEGVQFYQSQLRRFEVSYPTYPDKFQWFYKIPRRW